MRLFFALLPDSETRKQLLNAASGIELVGRARLVANANLHITLAFVGEVPNGDLHVFRAMGAPLGLRRCVIELDLLEYWCGPQALVLTARSAVQKLALQTEPLRAAVAVQIHTTRVGNPWRAHVTLARKVAQPPVLTEMPPISWVSHSFCLMSSKTGDDESVYTVVDSWPLLDKPCD